MYWRPGCPFCIKLRTQLRLARIPFRKVNILADPDAAAFVRSHNAGSETVPTLRITTPQGTESILTNPSLAQVRRALAV
ncbi:glutaredoxin domain-containing protein [Streptomyces sp. NPDC048337]|uniref:glutaredoxin domain-containing protein n=1 Tax=Streptomyces sp. NPDC048337 TaxID=3365535 RepID=UPI00371BF247